MSFVALPEFRGELSEFLSANYICVTKRTHRVFFRRTHRGSVSSLLRISALETVFRLFPSPPGLPAKSPRHFHQRASESSSAGFLRQYASVLDSSAPKPSCNLLQFPAICPSKTAYLLRALSAGNSLINLTRRRLVN